MVCPYVLEEEERLYMADYNVLLKKYDKLKKEYETYQNFAEGTIQMINEKNIKLEKNLDSLANLIEVSKYINSYLSDSNLIPVINDMIVGILGVMYSSIYISESSKLVIRATNVPDKNNIINDKIIIDEINNYRVFVINSCGKFYSREDVDIHSVIGVPITLRDKFIGYIIVEHTLYNFFNYEHVKFISAIANQIGIAIENSILYNTIREASIRDPLLSIYNRKYFFDKVESIIKKYPKKNFGVVMIDFDDFKRINDLYGHQFGDKVLMETVKLIQKNIDNNDILARYGGEEIIIYIDNVIDYDNITKKIDNIRFKISKNIIELKNIKKSITVSFGLSFYPKDGLNIEQVIYVADQMLYTAKKSGKNRTCSSV